MCQTLVVQEIICFAECADFLWRGQAEALDLVLLDLDILLREISSEFIDIHEVIILLRRTVAAVRVDAAALLRCKAKPRLLRDFPKPAPTSHRPGRRHRGSPI